MNPRIFYLAPTLGSALLMAWLFVYIWPLRRGRGAVLLLFCAASAAWWSFTEALLYLDFSQQAKILITKVQYLGVTTAPTAGLLFILVYVGQRQRLSRALLTGMYVVPMTVLALAWTNDLHHLTWASFRTDTSGKFPMLALVHGPAVWGLAFNYYFWSLYTLWTVWRQRRQVRQLFKRQFLLLLVAVALPLVANFIYMSRLSPVANLDLTCVAFSGVALLLGWGTYGYHLLEVLPVARAMVFREMDSGLLVLDSDGHLVDFNPAAQGLLGPGSDLQPGVPAELALAGFPALATALERPGAWRDEVEWPAGADRQVLEVRVSSVFGPSGLEMGRLVMLDDITERKQMENELKLLASTDPLTGADNRRSFFEKGGRQVLLARRHGRPLSLIILDLDRFKAINDQHGHHAGDQVLRAVAATCCQELRVTDIFGRLGGEEFGAVLPESGCQEAQEVARRLLTALRQAGALSQEQGGPGFTASLGVACLADGDPDLEALMRRADQALYRAKETGRDRWMMAETALV